MPANPTYQELEQRIKELENDLLAYKQEQAASRRHRETPDQKPAPQDLSGDKIRVSGIDIEWDTGQGTCTFNNLPVAMMWVDTTLEGLMSGVQAMVGTERFGLALQSEGRKSVEADWQVISQYADFREGFKAIANIAAVAGWGIWKLVSLDEKKKECCFRVTDSWEGRYQKALGICWGSGMLAGKVAGYCSKLFGTNCWADQTAFYAKGDEYDEFVAKPSDRSIEKELENLLVTDEATRADMAVALQKLREEISVRQRAEKTLRESEMKYRLLVENADDAIFIAQDGTVKFPNPKTEEMIGYTADELAAIPFINLIHAEDKAMVSERHQSRLRGETPPSTYSFRIIDKAGEVMWVQLNAVLIAWDERPATLNFLRDITPQKRMETQLQQAQKMEAIGTLAGGIAHDFNNILSAIMGFTELAMDHIDRDSLTYGNLREAIQAGKRAKDLVKQILTFSRQAEQNLQPIQFKLIVKEALKFLRSTLPSSIEICRNIASDARVLADPTHLHQLLMNLCANAKHAMRNTGGVLEVSLSEVELDTAFVTAHSGTVAGPYLKLTVADSGEGMPADVLGKIFDPFFTTKGKEEGTGLGLSVVHGIVKSYGGFITVHSEPNQGAAFDTFLPVIEAKVPPPAEVEEPLPRGSEQVLLVDDEKLLADIGKQMLERHGYRVTSRTSSVEALELFKAKPDDFDLIVTDMTMPNMSGLELAAEIISLRPKMRIILCTGFSEHISKEGIRSIGIRELMMKPIAMNELIRTARRVLDEQA